MQMMVDTPQQRWRRRVMYSSLSVAETLTIFPLIYLLMQELGGLRPSLPLMFLYWTGMGIGVVLIRQRGLYQEWQATTLVLVLLGGIGLSTLMTGVALPLLGEVKQGEDAPTVVYRAVLFGLLCGMIWLRGYAAGAKSPLTPMTVRRRINWAMGVFLFLAIFAQQMIPTVLIVSLPLFFASALMAAALARTENMTVRRDEAGRAFQAGWLRLNAAIVVGFVILGGILAVGMVLVNQSLLAAILFGFFMLIFTVAVGRDLAPIVMTLFFFFGMPVLIFQAVRSIGWEPPLPDLTPNEGSRQVEFGEVDRLEYGGVIEAIFSVVNLTTFQIGLAACLIGVFGFWALFLLLNRWDTGRRDFSWMDDEDIEGADRPWMKQLRRLRRQVGRSLFGGRLLEEFSIRWAYGRMERMAKKRGYPRRRAETPYEYRQKLALVFPQGETDIRTITEAYVKIRYGEGREETDARAAVQAALHRLRESAKGWTN